jgi:DNA replicative helicase MCM subunit Mcm2 (Cdc46/Mcm family)
VQNKTPYSENDYKNALKMVDLSLPNINVDIKATQITITSSNIENEMNVRQLMTEILALDRNFYIESMCGNTTNSCNGNALEIVIKGEKRNTILSNTAL